MIPEVERIEYLRNAIVVARANEGLSNVEMRVLEFIRVDLGATPSDLQKALNMFGVQRVDVSTFERFSTRVRNLEDMTLVAIADGELSDSEKQILLLVAHQVGLDQSHINAILRDAQTRLQRISP